MPAFSFLLPGDCFVVSCDVHGVPDAANIILHFSRQTFALLVCPHFSRQSFTLFVCPRRTVNYIS